MTTYYLVGKPFKNFPSFRLPFPFDSHAVAEHHNVCLGGGYQVIECEEPEVAEDETEAWELDQAVERQIEIDENKYGGNYDDR